MQGLTAAIDKEIYPQMLPQRIPSRSSSSRRPSAARWAHAWLWISRRLPDLLFFFFSPFDTIPLVTVLPYRRMFHVLTRDGDFVSDPARSGQTGRVVCWAAMVES